MDDRIPRFIESMHRLRELATKHGDTAFAEALVDCITNVSGGRPECPLGQLNLHGYAQAGNIPPAPAQRSQGMPEPPPPRSAGQPLNREGLLAHVHQLLKEDARFGQDTTMLAALEACQLFHESNPACPIRRLFEAAEKRQTP